MSESEGRRPEATSDPVRASSAETRESAARLDLSRLVAAIGDWIDGIGRINCDIEISADLPPVRADAGDLAVALQMLVGDAKRAMDGRGGAVSIRTGIMGAEKVTALRSFLIDREADCAFLEVADTGEGLEASTLQGLLAAPADGPPAPGGRHLAAVLDVVERHRGALEVHSAPDRGTRVRLVLPMDAGPLAHGGSSTG